MKFTAKIVIGSYEMKDIPLVHRVVPDGEDSVIHFDDVVLPGVFANGIFKISYYRDGITLGEAVSEYVSCNGGDLTFGGLEVRVKDTGVLATVLRAEDDTLTPELANALATQREIMNRMIRQL